MSFYNIIIAIMKGMLAMKTFDRITDLIGNTPLMKLTNYILLNGIDAEIYGKLEYFNPAGSVKDRIARAMIDDAEKKGSGLRPWPLQEDIRLFLQCRRL